MLNCLECMTDVVAGIFGEYSVGRLRGFLTSFDRDVEIVTKPRKGKSGKGGRITFSSLPA
jgi:hypothetical protein